MNLSKEELKWLATWEKRERLWLPFTRWLCILNGIVCLAAGAYIWHLMAKLLVNGGSDLAGLLFIPLFFFGMGGMWFGISISKWRGDIKLRLFLRLIREHQDEESD